MGKGPSRILHRVVEKCFKPGRTGFEYVPGVWFQSLEEARVDAKRVAQTSLAHRLFICLPTGSGGTRNVVEEFDLPPPAERMLAADTAMLRALDAARKARRP